MEGATMYVCQWHIDIPFGKQSEVVQIMKDWLKDSTTGSEFKRAVNHRSLVGHVGKSASHLLVEHTFESLADFEIALTGMGSGPFKQHAEKLAPYVVPGSQHWEILRILVA